MSFSAMLKKPSFLIPLVISPVALAMVLVHGTVFGAVRESGDVTAAHRQGELSMEDKGNLLTGAVGRWEGTNTLWLPSEPERRSRTAATIVPVFGDRFFRMDYTWSYEGAPHRGLLLIGYESHKDLVTAVWVDSWHMSDTFMICKGTVGESGAIDVRGSYSAPSGPDWGWRTVIDMPDGRTLRMRMYNITPDGTEVRAVEAVFNKAEADPKPSDE